MILATAGHRPDKLGGYTDRVSAELMRVSLLAIEALEPQKIVCGNAIGWDLAVGITAMRLGIPVICAVPFKGHGNIYRPAVQETMQRLMDYAERVVYVSNRTDGLNVGIMMKARNTWMVNHSDGLICLWNGRPSGTSHCINEAQKQGKSAFNFWENWTIK